MVLADVVVPADVAEYYGDKHANDAHNDAYNDARYDVQLHGVAADVVHPAVVGDAAVVLVDVAVPARMHIFLITGINMRIIVFS